METTEVVGPLQVVQNDQPIGRLHRIEQVDNLPSTLRRRSARISDSHERGKICQPSFHATRHTHPRTPGGLRIDPGHERPPRFFATTGVLRSHLRFSDTPHAFQSDMGDAIPAIQDLTQMRVLFALNISGSL